MVEGKLDEDERLRSHQAAHACAIINGYRAKKVNLNSTFRKLCAGRRTEDPNVEFAEMLAESRARAAAAKAKGNYPVAIAS